MVIYRARMQLRVRDGKGAKGRVLPLSERLLKELVNYWQAQHQGKAGHDSRWLFLGKKADQPMSRYAGVGRYCGQGYALAPGWSTAGASGLVFGAVGKIQ